MDRTQSQGVVAAGSPATAAAGAEMLRQGGNAADAAVAAAFASFVAESTLSHTGGAGFALVYAPQGKVAPRGEQTPQGETLVYDFFADMPGLASNGDINPAKLDFRATRIEFAATLDTFYIGRGSVAVPGNAAGLCALASDYGCLSLSELLAPAIRLARDGVTVSASMASIAALIEPIVTATHAISRIFSPDGHLIRVGDRFRNPALAATLERLSAAGPALFYRGALAEAIVTDQATNGGLVTAEDLRCYQVRLCPPLRIDYRGRTIVTNPPPSSGGTLIAFSLRLLEGLEVGEFEFGSAAHLALLAEVMRATIQVRAARDPAQLTGASDLDHYLSEAHVAPYRQKVRAALASGRPGQDLPGEPRHRGSTTHISAIDGQGMAVGLTTTPGESAGFAVGDTGVIMNNLLGESDLYPHGFHKLPPGVRLSSMMAPTILLNGGRPRAVLGSGGSNRLRTAILQAISNIVDFNMPVETAVNLSRMHFEGRVIELEGGFDPSAAAGLEQLGYRVNRWPRRDMFFGGVHTAFVENGALGGAGDQRRGGAVEIVGGSAWGESS